MPTNAGHLKRLERLHSRFSSYDFARSSAFNLTLVECRRFHTAIQVYKILKRLSPSYLLSTFRSALSVIGHAGRNVHHLYVPAVRLNYGKRSLYYRGTTIWNSLPTSITEMNSLNVTGFDKTRLLHTSRFATLKNHNSIWEYAITFKF